MIFTENYQNKADNIPVNNEKSLKKGGFIWVGTISSLYYSPLMKGFEKTAVAPV